MNIYIYEDFKNYSKKLGFSFDDPIFNQKHTFNVVVEKGVFCPINNVVFEILVRPRKDLQKHLFDKSRNAAWDENTVLCLGLKKHKPKGYNVYVRMVEKALKFIEDRKRYLTVEKFIKIEKELKSEVDKYCDLFLEEIYLLCQRFDACFEKDGKIYDKKQAYEFMAIIRTEAFNAIENYWEKLDAMEEKAVVYFKTLLDEV